MGDTGAHDQNDKKLLVCRPERAQAREETLHTLLLRSCGISPIGIFKATDADSHTWKTAQRLADEFWHRWSMEYSKFIVKEDIYSWPPEPKIVLIKKLSSRPAPSLSVTPRSSRSRQMVLRAAGVALMACTLQMHQKNHISRGCASISLHMPDRQQKCKTVFHFSPSSRTAECLPRT
ncbi:hypothetical protein EVAR_91887_1 [Eumeta japonica]|uniref:DUF5641 domain-containing protein n=1 Tax=Eumeta variegata TaxID=151549 RepID=A0A4C1TP23_EUMVA|nr:hypothetical protein EVAR_91887_1 [Eumeta japonica]